MHSFCYIRNVNSHSFLGKRQAWNILGYFCNLTSQSLKLNQPIIHFISPPCNVCRQGHSGMCRPPCTTDWWSCSGGRLKPSPPSIGFSTPHSCMKRNLTYFFSIGVPQSWQIFPCERNQPITQVKYYGSDECKPPIYVQLLCTAKIIPKRNGFQFFYLTPITHPTRTKICSVLSW